MMQKIFEKEVRGCFQRKTSEVSSLVREGNQAIPVPDMYEDPPSNVADANTANKPSDENFNE